MTEQLHEIVIDGKNAVMGRLASYVAKQALFGKRLVVTNCNEIIILGNRKDILRKYSEKVKKGGSSQKGPIIIRTPERMLKRAIRGMLPHKQGRGEDATGRIMCHNETPEEYLNVKKIVAGKEKHTNFIKLKEVAKMLKN